MHWNELRRHRAHVADHVVHRALPHETVLLNVRTSTYHTVDEVGARFFEVMRTAPTIEATAQQLAAEYEQPLDRITSDLTAFCRELSERGLVEFVAADEPVAGRRA